MTIPLGLYGAARPVASGLSITDSFNRADNPSSLGNTDTGQPWEVANAVWGVTGGECYRVSASGSARGHASVDFGSPDMRVTATRSAIKVGDYGSLVARFTNANNCYLFTVEDGVSLIRRQGGTATILVNIGNSYSSGDEVALQAVESGGSTVLTMYRNGAQVGTFTDSQAGRPSGTRGGLFAFHNGSGGRWDDFSITEPTG